MDNATIAAIATPPGEGGIGVVRISGPDAAQVASRIFRKAGRRREVDLHQVESHRLLFGTVVDPATGDTVDEVLLAWMAGPHTYTREDTVELSCHGGPVPLQETLRLALAAGARHAEPGEFTLRAFLNGRLDLTQAEAEGLGIEIVPLSIRFGEEEAGPFGSEDSAHRRRWLRDGPLTALHPICRNS